ncbi:hypothetical protein [Salinarimonas chemoclinalis]|uniref:hypothetical protein n=1 Tax=Salinarimonas chemoclinalis TaxID=3241599 RepID=UPI0035564287
MDERKRPDGTHADGIAKPGEPWRDPDDSPEWTDAMFERADIYEGDQLIRRGRRANDDDETHPQRV